MEEKSIPIATLKENVAEAKAEIRKFRRANKLKPDSKIEDAKVAAELETLTAVLEEAQAEYDAVKEAKKSGKSGVGNKLYSYGQIKDPETGEMRDLEKQEAKRWRTHARKVAKKEGLVASEVPFDPDYFAPKVKKEKPKKEKDAEPKEGEPKDAEPKEAPKKVAKKARKVEDDD
jgi:hypothetical protein